MSAFGDRAALRAQNLLANLNRFGVIVAPVAQALDVQVRTQGGAAVTNATVQVFAGAMIGIGAVPLAVAQTDDDGDVIIRVAAGTYSVRVLKDWHVPDPQDVLAQVVGAGALRVVNAVLEELRYTLHVDADRDGLVDALAAPAVALPWTYGAHGQGAIVPVNLDDDAATGNADAADNVVNGVADATSDIAHLEIRRVGSAIAPPANWQATLSIHALGLDAAADGHIRVFNGVAAGSVEVIGPLTAAQHQFSLLVGGFAPASYAGGSFGVEATRFAGQDAAGNVFGGEFLVRLTVSRPNPFGPPHTYDAEAILRVNPWLIPSHEEASTRVYVCDVQAPFPSPNAAFAGTLGGAVAAAGAAITVPQRGDRWMQDCMELGYTNWPGNAGAGQRMNVAMKAHRGQADNGPPHLDQYPASLRTVNFGFYYPGRTVGMAAPPGPSTFDSTGNLEVTPPCRSTAPHDYPWGRVYYGNGLPTPPGLPPPYAGEPFNAETASFLAAQGIQAPILIDTEWLMVGHVDEMMSFLPVPGGPPFKQWKLMIASPREAYQQLVAAPPGATVMNGRTLDFHPGGAVLVQTTAGAMLGGGASPIPHPGGGGPFTWTEIRQWNLNYIQPRLDAVVQQLVQEIGVIAPNDVIELPVVFIPGAVLPWNGPAPNHLTTAPGTPGGYLALALTADVVNMLVLGPDANAPPQHHLVIPIPFGPENPPGTDLFQAAIALSLNNANPNLVYTWIDDWNSYHRMEGEVHCGTNTLRQPANVPLWTASPAARWWERP